MAVRGKKRKKKKERKKERKRERKKKTKHEYLMLCVSSVVFLIQFAISSYSLAKPSGDAS